MYTNKRWYSTIGTLQTKRFPCTQVYINRNRFSLESTESCERRVRSVQRVRECAMNHVCISLPYRKGYSMTIVVHANLITIAYLSTPVRKKKKAKKWQKKHFDSAYSHSSICCGIHSIVIPWFTYTVVSHALNCLHISSPHSFATESAGCASVVIFLLRKFHFPFLEFIDIIEQHQDDSKWKPALVSQWTDAYTSRRAFVQL